MEKVPVIQPPIADAVFHESGKQRQHVRVDIPSTLTLDSLPYPLIDLSAGGFKISTKEMATFPIGKRCDVMISFPFDSFSFSIEAEGVVLHTDEKTSQIGFRFDMLDKQQLALLQHVIRSYLAGQIVSSESLLQTTLQGSSLPIKASERPLPQKRRIKPLILIALIGLAGLTGAGFLAKNLSHMLSVVVATSATVEGGALNVRATENGTFHALTEGQLSPVEKGAPLARFTKQTQEDTVITSPCDCVILQQTAQEGEFKAVGETLFKLLPVDQSPWIIAVFSSEDVYKIKASESASVQIAGGAKPLEGKIVEFFPEDGNNQTVKVKIELESPLKPEWVGRPAYVEVPLSP